MDKLDFPLHLHSHNRGSGTHTISEVHSEEELRQDIMNIAHMKMEAAEIDKLARQLLNGERGRVQIEEVDVELHATKYAPES